jgi:hypothetical protein
MVIRFYTIRKLEGSHGSPRRNFSFPQIPQIFFNLESLLNSLPELESTDNIPRSAASLSIISSKTSSPSIQPMPDGILH